MPKLPYFQYFLWSFSFLFNGEIHRGNKVKGKNLTAEETAKTLAKAKPAIIRAGLKKNATASQINTVLQLPVSKWCVQQIVSGSNILVWKKIKRSQNPKDKKKVSYKVAAL